MEFAIQIKTLDKGNGETCESDVVCGREARFEFNGVHNPIPFWSCDRAVCVGDVLTGMVARRIAQPLIAEEPI